MAHLCDRAVLLLFLIALAGCTAQPAELANPASQGCEDLGYSSIVRTNPDGSQTGYCVLQDGTECEEWALFRGECP